MKKRKKHQSYFSKCQCDCIANFQGECVVMDCYGEIQRPYLDKISAMNENAAAFMYTKEISEVLLNDSKEGENI